MSLFLLHRPEPATTCSAGRATVSRLCSLGATSMMVSALGKREGLDEQRRSDTACYQPYRRRKANHSERRSNQRCDPAGSSLFCDLLKHGEGKGEIEQLLKDSVPPWYARDRMGLGRSIQPAR